LGATLAEVGSCSGILDVLTEDLLHESRDEALIVLVALTYFGCRRALDSGQFDFSPASHQAINEGLIVALAREVIRGLGQTEDKIVSTIELIMSRTNRFGSVWNENMKGQPNPHHFVAKEAWAMISGARDADPAKTITLAGMLSASTVTVVEFLRESRPLILDM